MSCIGLMAAYVLATATEVCMCIPEPSPNPGDVYSFVAVLNKTTTVAAMELDEDPSDGIAVCLQPMIPINAGDVWYVRVTSMVEPLDPQRPPVTGPRTRVGFYEDFDFNGDGVVGGWDFLTFRMLQLSGTQFLRFRDVFGLRIVGDHYEEP